MLTNTQISSYLISEKVWNEGIPGNNQMSPLSIPARDALEIERRRNNNINLRNEDHRYTIACERIQALAMETYENYADLPKPIIWAPRLGADSGQPTALAYITTLEIIYRGLFKSLNRLPYQRFLAVFFPPNDKEKYLSLYRFLLDYPKIDSMMEHASNLSKRMGPDYELSAKDCKLAILTRLNLLVVAEAQNCGLVDVISIV